METAEPLASVCELAYSVAREGVEATPPMDPPAPMRSYLYVAQLPRRAVSVTQRVLEEDPSFRARVAEQANEPELGRAGYLWLTRPAGWEAEYAALVADDVDAEAIPGATSAPARLEVEGAPTLPNRRAAVPDPPVFDADGLATAAPSAGADPAPASTDVSGLASGSDLSETRSSIGDELDSLRMLVDRLADERHLVTSSYGELESEVQARRAESESMSSDLVDAKTVAARARTEAEAAQGELATIRAEAEHARAAADAARADADAARAEIDAARVEADAARSNLEEARAEAEVARNEADAARSSLALRSTELDDAKSQVEAKIAELEDVRSSISEAGTAAEEAAAELSRVRTDRDRLQSDNEVLTAEIDALAGDLHNLQTELGTATSSRSEAAAKLTQLEEDLKARNDDLDAMRNSADDAIAERDAALVDASTIREERDAVVARLEVAEQARVDLEAQLEDVSSQWQTVKVELAELAEQRQMLSAEIERFAEAQASTANARQELLNSLAVQLGKVEAERDQLLQSLSETTERLASTRNTVESSQQQVLDQLGAVGDSVADAEGVVSQLTETVGVVGQDLDTLEGSTKGELSLAAITTDDAPSTPATSEVPPPRSDGAFEVDPLHWIEDDTIGEDVVLPEGMLDADDVETVDDTEGVAGGEPTAAELTSTDLFGDPPFGAAAGITLSDEDTDVQDTDVEDIDVEVASVDPSAADGDALEAIDDASGLVSPVAGLSVGGLEEAAAADAASDDAAFEATIEALKNEDNEDNEAGHPVDVALGAASESELADLDEKNVLSDLERSLASMGMGAEEETFTPPAVTPDPEPLLPKTRTSDAQMGSDVRVALEIPNDLTDDLEIAKFITGTHNVMVLVHGDHVAEMGWPSMSVAERRTALVRYLGDLTAEVGAAADVIFDAAAGGDEMLPESHAVRVRLTADSVTAPSILPDVVDGYPRQWPVAVVTNDEDLRAAVGRRGATIMTNSQLLDLFTWLRESAV